MQNEVSGQAAFKVIDGDKMIVRQIFSDDKRKEVMTYWRSRYGSVTEDADRDIICFEDSE